MSIVHDEVGPARGDFQGSPYGEQHDERPLTREDRARRTRELLDEAHRCPDPERQRQLLDQVVVVNRGVAEAVARRYHGRGVADEDLEQVAYEGLIKAVRKFDPTLRPDLLTYAVPTIRGELQRYFRDHAWTIRPPRSITELQWKLSRSRADLVVELGREPTTAELARGLGVPTRQVEAALLAYGAFTPSSLDQPVGESASLLDLVLGDQRDRDDQEAVEARLVIGPALRRLSSRDRYIPGLRYYQERTQAQIGEELGVTQMQVSRLLEKILRQLRGALTTPDAPPAASAGLART